MASHFHAGDEGERFPPFFEPSPHPPPISPTASRFRADEGDERVPLFFEPSPPRPPNPASTDRYFSHQAIRAGFEAADGPMSRPRMSLEALERELREEKIREEIVTRRIAQRRMLEDQAWREMEMAVAMRMGRHLDQPLPVEPLMLPPPSEYGRDTAERRRFAPGPVERRDLPKVVIGGSSALLQEFGMVDEASGDVEFGKRDAEFEEAGKKTVIKVDKKVIPPKLSATKRKAPATILGNISSKFPRPAQKEWSCALCEVSATSEEGLNEHLQGRKHLNKAAQLAPKKNLAVTALAISYASGSSSSVPKQQGDTKKKPVAKGVRKVGIEVDGKLHEVTEKGRFLWCWMCRVKCNGRSSMISHLSGKRHLLEQSTRLDAAAKRTLPKEEVVLATDNVTLQNVVVEEAMDKDVTLRNEEFVEATENGTSQNEDIAENTRDPPESSARAASE